VLENQFSVHPRMSARVLISYARASVYQLTTVSGIRYDLSSVYRRSIMLSATTIVYQISTGKGIKYESVDSPLK